ncbi:MAG: sigma 54-interacting transcriptional regulator [Proteobacteria bacterium]|nr:sigma 54-interacting transcriptional regulator [Pseudomonadota bacterium]
MANRFQNYIAPTKISYLDGKPTTIHLQKCRIVTQQKSNRREWIFEHGLITIGSLDDNNLVIKDDTVSRYHAQIIQADESYVIRDLDSTNGTWVNQVRIKEAWLSPGCLLRFGESEFIFQPLDEEVAVIPSNEEKFGDIIGGNVKMREIYGILEKIAPTNATVVIEGETGTGKEVIAHTLHKMSQRAKKPFVVFDCGAVPESLIESELFGHEKGSFTGAIMTRQGLFELAQGGTIFLDELGELNLELQPKLLRVLEQREVRRVGAAKAIPVDVRVVAATNRKLEEEVRNNHFREDLFYRLSVVRIFLPPLRDRIDDLPLLVKHFLKNSSFNRDANANLKLRSISREALSAMTNYTWPGNVRELLNVVERACSLADGDCIELGDLPEHVAKCAVLPPKETQTAPAAATAAATVAPATPTTPQPETPPSEPALDLPSIDYENKTFKEAKEEWLSSFEGVYIRKLLEKNNYNISQASRESDIDRKYFRKLMKKYGITNPNANDSGDSDDE